MAIHFLREIFKHAPFLSNNAKNKNTIFLGLTPKSYLNIYCLGLRGKYGPSPGLRSSPSSACFQAHLFHRPRRYLKIGEVAQYRDGVGLDRPAEMLLLPTADGQFKLPSAHLISCVALWKVRGAPASGRISKRTAAALASSLDAWVPTRPAVTPASASQASWKLANSKVVVTFSLFASSPAARSWRGDSRRVAQRSRADASDRMASAQSCPPSAEILRCRLPQVRPKPRPRAGRLGASTPGYPPSLPPRGRSDVHQAQRGEDSVDTPVICRDSFGTATLQDLCSPAAALAPRAPALVSISGLDIDCF